MTPEPTKNGLADILATSGLVQAQSLEILFHNMCYSAENKETFLRIGSLFEDIGNIYLNISEQISHAYAEFDMAAPNVVDFTAMTRQIGTVV